MIVTRPTAKMPQTADRRKHLPACHSVAAAAFTVLLGATPSPTLGAEPATYRPAASRNGFAGCEIAVPYTFGTHGFEIGELRGEIRVNWDTPATASGRLIVPIASLRGGGNTLNCHMREALGLDYSKSAFPGAHVCSDGQLPASGKDSVVFPEISFDITNLMLAGDPTRVGGRVRALVSGRFTIHGASRDDKLDLRMTVGEQNGTHPRTVRIEGEHTIRLSDYGIKVKPALVIKAGDSATVRLNFVLKEVG